MSLRARSPLMVLSSNWVRSKSPTSARLRQPSFAVQNKCSHEVTPSFSLQFLAGPNAEPIRPVPLAREASGAPTSLDGYIRPGSHAAPPIRCSLRKGCRQVEPARAGRARVL